MSSLPLVSVIIPTYNYCHLISYAIDSILNSDFPSNEVEIIIIDDGSTDETYSKISAYGKYVNYLSQENSGKAWATRVGVDMARGKYIFNLDADDLFLPNKLRKVVDVFEREPSCVHVAHPAIYWNTQDGTKKAEQLPAGLLGQKNRGKDVLNYFYKGRMLFGGGSTFAARTEVLKRIFIPKQIDMFIDEFLVLATLNEGNTFFIEEPLSVWRIHGKNFSGIGSGNNVVANQRPVLLRRLASIDAVLSSVMRGEFDREIKELYLLKVKVEHLAAKEQLNQKTLSDILDLIRHTPALFSAFSFETLKIIHHYRVLNRVLPTFVVKLAKQAKYISKLGMNKNRHHEVIGRLSI